MTPNESIQFFEAQKQEELLFKHHSIIQKGHKLEMQQIPEILHFAATYLCLCACLC